MHKKTSVKKAMVTAGGMLLVLLTMTVMVPVLNELTEIEVEQNRPVEVLKTPLPEQPQEQLVTVIYVMEGDSKKISSIYIEVFRAESQSAAYMQIPVDTRVTLSEELYKSLQAYAPELPQYLKLSNMAEGFSREYGLKGCNRILSEVLGFSLEHYVRTDTDTLENWWKILKKEKAARTFFDEYTVWLEETSADLSLEARWMYFESWKMVDNIIMEQAYGTREKDGFVLSAKRSRERLQELMAGKSVNSNEENAEEDSSAEK